MPEPEADAPPTSVAVWAPDLVAVLPPYAAVTSAVGPERGRADAVYTTEVEKFYR